MNAIDMTASHGSYRTTSDTHLDDFSRPPQAASQGAGVAETRTDPAVAANRATAEAGAPATDGHGSSQRLAALTSLRTDPGGAPSVEGDDLALRNERLYDGLFERHNTSAGESLARRVETPRHRELDDAPGAGRDTLGELRPLLAQMADDPAAVLMRIQCELRDRRTADLRGQATDAASRQEALQQEKLKAMGMATSAANAAGQIQKGIPPEVQTALKFIVVIAAVVASAFTGGATAALAIAGAVLMLAAGPLTEAAVKSGLIQQKDAQWLKLGLELAGTIMMAGAGFAAAGASTASAVAESVNITSTCMGIYDGVKQGAAAACTYVANDAQIQADGYQSRIEGTSDELGRTTDDLRDELATFARCAKRLNDIVQTEGETRRAATQAWA